MIKKSEYLFELIQSLNKNEKGYFKKLNSFHVRGQQNNYHLLFNVIAKQKEYNEVEVLSHFKDQNLINNFSVAKAYLYQLILKSLRSFYSLSSIDGEIQALTANIEILYHKACYGQCKKILVKAKNLCSQYERFEQQLSLLQWKRRLLSAELPVNLSYKEDRKILEETEAIIACINNHTAYQLLYNRAFTIAFKYGYNPPPVEERRELHSIISDPLMENEHCALSHAAKIQYHSIACICSILTEKDKACYVHRKKQLALLEENPLMITENPLSYVNVLNSLFIDTYKLSKYEELPIIIRKLKEVPPRYAGPGTESLGLITFAYSCTAELALCIATASYQEGMLLLPEMEKEFERYEGKLSRRHEVLFLSSFSHICFATGDFKKALFWVNKLLDVPIRGNPENMQRFVRFARIFNLFVHYELGNIDLLEYILKSTKRFYAREKKLYKAEGFILDFFRKIIDVNSPKEKRILFLELKEKIEHSLNDPLEKTILERFDFVSWLESKIEQRLFADVLKEKAEQKIQELATD